MESLPKELHLESLPKELHLEILSYLFHADLVTLSATSRTLACLTRPLIFDILSFDGSPQDTSDELLWDDDQIGRQKTVELRNLPLAVDEVSAIAPYVKTFKFTPAVYNQGFWTRYRLWLRNEMIRHIDTEDIDDDFSDGWDGDAEFGFVGLRRAQEQRYSRPERERLLIEQAERKWEEGIAEQEGSQEIIQKALSKLLREMTNLGRVEVGCWRYNLKDDGLGLDYVYDEVREQFSCSSLAWKNFELLASALQTSDRHYKELHIPFVDPSLITDSPSVRFAFTGLTMLSLCFETVDFIRLERTEPANTHFELMKCSQPTLQRLELRFARPGDKNAPNYDCTLASLLCEPYTASMKEDTPLVFPCLKIFELSALKVHTPSLAAFLSAQPVLKTVFFHNIWLINATWTDIAKSLPPTCQLWFISDCGRLNRTGTAWDNGPRWAQEFLPFKEPLPVLSGWKVRDPKRVDGSYPKLWFDFGREAFGRRIRVFRELGIRREEMVTLKYAAFERITALEA